jgi:hypothetical protein
MSDFQKRHYQAIAECFQQDCPGTSWDPNKRAQWQTLRDTIAHMFARDNGNFRTDQFREACEPGANVRPTKNAPLRDMIWPKEWHNAGPLKAPKWEAVD